MTYDIHVGRDKLVKNLAVNLKGRNFLGGLAANGSI
jgi:hypothetical protein